MYRHTTPTPLKYILQTDFDSVSRVPLADYEADAELVWGDYPGDRTGNGIYCDISYEGIPVGRLWANDDAAGLLHVPLENRSDRHEYEIQNWNASMEIRRSFNSGLSAGEAFDAVADQFDHGAIISGPLEGINFPEMDAIFYQGRYDPESTNIWWGER